MPRFLAALAACCLLLVGSRPVGAQQWNDSRTLDLVRRATELRQRQLADTALTDYTATAHGYLTFLAQLGSQEARGRPTDESFTEPPKVVKADELALQVYWQAPDRSKQVIVGRRDSLLLPTDIQYHQDHLGIVQNNFPSIIRLGEGDEVADVPHPLSPAGRAVYDYAIRDSLSITMPGRRIDVYEVRVRPKQEDEPRVIGAVYIDRQSAQVVRMALNFTRAAFLDKQLDDLSIVLENGLIDGRFWLPVRQEIEIRRSGSWLDFPARGIIRGRWEICCYEVNTGLDPALFAGQEIVSAPPTVLARYPWQGRILDSLPPDVRAVTDEDLRKVQDEARNLVHASALAHTTGAQLSARRLSDFARVNRVEGLALGGAGRLRLGAGRSLAVGGRYGIDDHQGKWRASVDFRRPNGAGVQLFAERGFRETGDVVERSLMINSLAAQEFGSDYTDPYDVRGGGIGIDAGAHLGLRWRLDGAYMREGPLAVHAAPATGRYEPTIPAARIDAARATIAVDHPTALAFLGTELRWTAELRGARYTADTLDGAGTLGRLALSANIERPLGDDRIVLRTTIAAVRASRGAPPPQDLVYLGGPTTGPGYAFHEFAGRFAGSQYVEWRMPVPFLPIPLANFGRAPASATLAPFAGVVYVDRSAGFRQPREGWYPSVGVGALLFFDLLRVDVARGLRDGGWSFSVDLTRELWGIL